MDVPFFYKSLKVSRLRTSPPNNPMANCQSLNKSLVIDSPDNKLELREKMNEILPRCSVDLMPGSTKEHPLSFILSIDGVSRRRH